MTAISVLSRNTSVALPTPDALLRYLDGRVPSDYLRRRLRAEERLENYAERVRHRNKRPRDWLISPWLIGTALRLSLLHGRARRNALRPEIVENRVTLQRLPAAFDGVRILHLSDLHIDMEPSFADNLGWKLRELDYDYCVLTGDYRYLIHGPADAALEGLRTLSASLRGPVYGILGNHDPLALVPPLEALGVRMLINESVTLRRDGETVGLLGVDDPHGYRSDDLARALTGVDRDRCALLLAHTPAYYRHAEAAGIDFMLSGHTHGGQLCLPGRVPLIYDANCPRRMISGAWRSGPLQGYTSAGIGASIVVARLNCPPEIVIHTLRCG